MNSLRNRITRIEEQKTEYSRSYLFKVPVLDPYTKTQLQKYKITQIKESQIIVEQVNDRLILENSQTIAIVSFIMVTIFQVALFIFYFLNTLVQGQGQEIGVLVIQITIAVAYITIAIYVNRIKNYTSEQQKKYSILFAICWFGYMGSSLTQFLAGHVFVINLQIFTGLYLVYWIIMYCLYSQFDDKGSRSLRKRYYFIGAFFLILMMIFGELTFRSICNIKSKEDSADEYIFIALIGLQIVFFIVIKVKQFMDGDDIFDKYTYFELCQFMYLEIVGLSFVFSIIFQVPYHFVIFTQAINLIYIPLCIYFFFEIKRVENDINEIKDRLQQVTLYQKSDTVLTYSKEEFLRVKQEDKRKHLTSCIICLSQQSRFFYNGCMHVCCGYTCILQWLKNEVPKCPLCRTFSDEIGEIQRIDNSQFILLNKYRNKA